ncbi:MAG: nucleotidyltransferase family protein [Cyanobacteria bacterium P01_F01_bin.143]
MNLKELKAYRNDILALAQSHHAPNIRVFGSVARGEATENSDVDFLVDVAPEQSILDLIGLIHALSDLLGCEVDVAQSTVLNPLIRDKILADAIYLEEL